MRIRLRQALACIVVLGLGCGLCGCFNPFDPAVRGVGITEPAPIPDSPGNALLLLEWCYKNRAAFEYRELFDDNYRFVFGALDPDGFAYRDVPWTREDELESTTHLFQGGDVNQPAASNITISMDRNFRVTADPYHPGRGHVLIRTTVELKVTVSDQESEVSGYANFFLVRGDSAAIPIELTRRGFAPDSNRWYILRHEDDTFQSSTAMTVPIAALAPARGPTSHASFATVVSSWGALKHWYR